MVGSLAPGSCSWATLTCEKDSINLGKPGRQGRRGGGRDEGRRDKLAWEKLEK